MKSGDKIKGLVDSYLVDGVVGEGGFGVTYKALRDSNNEWVALKQMRIEKLDSWKALELFEREAAVLQNLNHPSIPRYIEFFATTPNGPVAHTGEGDQAPDSLILVQHFVAGADLGARIKSKDAFEIDEVEKILRQTLEALSYLHELSPPVVHRDVTPKNIIVDEDGHTFLVDFGAIQHKLHEKTLGGSTAVGTLGFIPLEQSLGKARPASDLYSLAVTMVVLMTGMQPEELPLDDATGKIDLKRLGLKASSSADQKKNRIIQFLEQALEPIVGKRLPSARTALETLDGKTQKASAPAIKVEKAKPSWVRTLFILCLGGSVGSAAIIYPLGFDNFSETEMVAIAPFWVLPAAFGLAGLMVQDSKRPIVNAIIGTVIGGVALAVFLFGIFPSL